jgi:spore germination protein YaaH
MNHTMKKRFSLLLVVAMIAALAVPAHAVSGFTDIPAGSALTAEVEKANAYGLMNGYNSDTFGYSDPVTRVQFVTVLGRMMGWFTGAQTQGSHITSAMQLPESLNAAYTSAIDLAIQHDTIDTDAAFRPNDAITRGEMSEMLVRALGLKGAAQIEETQSLPFTDVTSRKGYIAVAYQIGMTNGMTASTFAPDNRSTRAQAAAMLVRIYEKLNQKTDFVNGFYAISSYNQIGFTDNMNAVSAGWSRMKWDGASTLLSTTSADGNEYCIPTGYNSVTDYLEGNGTPLNLSVFMGESDGVRDLLSSETGRTQAVEQIVNELSVSYKTIGKNPYSGVTIDFEGLRSAQKADFNAFLTELSSKVHSLNKTLFVCVSPALTTGSYYDGYDYRTIGSLADRVILMAYDYDARDMSSFVGTTYYKTAAPAPIDQIYASLLAITDSVTGVADKSKILLGICSKPVAWQIDASGALVSGTPVNPSWDTVVLRANQSDTVTGWSSAYQMPYFTYTANGNNYFLWYENEQSAASKMDAAKLLGITGASVWRLGILPGKLMDGIVG